MKEKQANMLVLIGLVVFLLGLIIGLFVHNMTNPRMGLSAHLEGIMNGMFLIIVGLIWTKLIIKHTLLKITYWLAIYGTLANLLAVTIAAITGHGRMMPIAGGQEGTAIIEGVISFLLLSLSLSMLLVCSLCIVGLYKYNKQVLTD